MVYLINMNLHSTMYLFKRVTRSDIVRLENIYIPLCIYLNWLSLCVVVAITNIYIPLCIYLNSSLRILRRSVFDIYIPLCIYLNIREILDYKSFKPNLHSTMYLFKRQLLHRVYTCWVNLHSTMYLFKPSSITFYLCATLYLHSTMYLFKQVARYTCSWLLR